MQKGKANAVPRTVMIYPEQWAKVIALAKDQGYPSNSSALRRIIDEWVEFKRYDARIGSHVGEPS